SEIMLGRSNLSFSPFVGLLRRSLLAHPAFRWAPLTSRNTKYALPSVGATTPRCLFSTDYSPPIALIKEVRARTQAGLTDCRNALVESQGDVEKAVEALFSKGRSFGPKKNRTTGEGVIALAGDLHSG